MEELYGLPVGLWALDDCHLYLWTTNAFLEEAHRLAKTWGFTPRTVLTWVKGRVQAGRVIQQIGLGHFYRNTTEHVLFCVRGKLDVLNHDAPTAFIAERHNHSEKPAAFYDMVQHMSPPPYLDVFARVQRFGWDTWGDEAFDFREHGIWHKEPADAS
jgi:N6-adenosine-specific RNA methylase IME4